MATDVKISADLLLAADFILLFTLSKTIANKDTALEKNKAKHKEEIYLYDIIKFLLLYLTRKIPGKTILFIQFRGKPRKLSKNCTIGEPYKKMKTTTIGIGWKRSQKSKTTENIKTNQRSEIFIPCGGVEEGLDMVALAPSLIRHLLV